MRGDRRRRRAGRRGIGADALSRRACAAPLGAGAPCAAGGRARRARRASSPVRACASGLRWRRYGSSTCSNSTASRSANVRYMRRCRASMPWLHEARRDPRDRRARPRRTARGRWRCRRRRDEPVLLERAELLVGELGGARRARRGSGSRPSPTDVEVVGAGFVDDDRGATARGLGPLARLARLLEQRRLLRRPLAPRRVAALAFGVGRRVRRRLRPPPVRRAGSRRRASSSSSRSLITFSGRKCSFCWRRMQRSRSTSCGVELAVARRRALRVDEALALEEADLRDRDVGELVAELGQHLADREVLAAAPRSVSRRSPPSDEAQAEPADLELVAVVQPRFVDPLVVDVGAVERPDVAQLVAVVVACRSTTWRRDTVMSSRKMSESGWRPTRSSRPSSRYDEPGFGPCRTTSSPTPGGQARRGSARARPRRRPPRRAASVSVVASSSSRRERRAARRAEARLGLVHVPAPGADHRGQATDGPRTPTTSARPPVEGESRDLRARRRSALDERAVRGGVEQRVDLGRVGASRSRRSSPAP